MEADKVKVKRYRIIVILCFLAASVALADDYDDLLDRLRRDNPAEYEKVKSLDRATGLRFLQERYSRQGDKKEEKKQPVGDKSQPKGDKTPVTNVGEKKTAQPRPLPARVERFTIIETIQVGEFAIDLCRREDGAFGLGEIRKGVIPIRRADFLITWQADGKFPTYGGRTGSIISLRNPNATLTISPERRENAGTTFLGLKMQFKAERGPIIETVSWEVGGSSRGLSYWDGYRGWSAPAAWQPADAVMETNPKLMPSLLSGTGFQFEHREKDALLIFHATPGDRLKNVSRGEALEFETIFDGVSEVNRYVFLTETRDSRINLWTRGYEMAHAELRKTFELPARSAEAMCAWPPFGRIGFREMAAALVELSAQQGFTSVYIDVIWDNIEQHGGEKNMNVWDLSVCGGYGGEAGLRALVEECHKRGLKVIAWTPSGHLNAGAPIWGQHPEWVLKNRLGDKALNPSGIWQGDLSSGFHGYYRDRIAGVVRKFGLDGLWMDSHLGYAQQYQSPGHAARLAEIYRDFIRAGARQFIVEGDASVLGTYGIGIDDSWKQEWGKIPDPDLYYGATLMGWFHDPRLHQEHFRRWMAAGATWVVSREFLDSGKLVGAEFDAARRDALAVVADYRRVKDKMTHRFVHADDSGYTWTNDRDKTKVVWLLHDATLPNGQRGEAGKVYIIEERTAR